MIFLGNLRVDFANRRPLRTLRDLWVNFYLSSATKTLLRYHHPFDSLRLPGHLIALDHYRTQPHISRRRLEPHWHIRQKLADNQLLLDSDDALVRPRHSYIGDVRRTTRKHPLIRSRYMRVSANDRRYAPIHIPTKRHLF